jgi:hypothetical protein
MEKFKSIIFRKTNFKQYESPSIEKNYLKIRVLTKPNLYKHLNFVYEVMIEKNFSKLRNHLIDFSLLFSHNKTKTTRIKAFIIWMTGPVKCVEMMSCRGFTAIQRSRK